MAGETISGRSVGRARAGWAASRVALLATVVGLAACGGPLGPFAGGRLSGDPGPPLVADWSFAEDASNAQLEVRPGDPYSVNVWFASVGPRLYVPSSMILGPLEPEERTWVALVVEDPRVRIRLGGRVFDRIAQRVTDPVEFDAARVALETRYELDPAERDPARTIWIYRLRAVDD